MPWVELTISPADYERLAPMLADDAKMIYTPVGQRTLHLWPQQPQGGTLTKLILCEATTPPPGA